MIWLMGCFLFLRVRGKGGKRKTRERKLVSAQEGGRGLVLSPPADGDLEPEIGKNRNALKDLR